MPSFATDRGIHRYFAAAALFGIFCEALYAASAGSALTVIRVFSTSFLLSLAAASAGAFLGFLFGVPRHINASNDTADRSSGISFNNNFQEISDWLTKILVGIGLIQIRPIANKLQIFVGWIAGSLSFSDAYVVLIVAPYVVLGFILAYLWTVRDYAREETEFIERKHRITDTTLAAEAETILTSPNASQADKKFWGERLSRAVDQNPLNKRIVLVASRYDAEVDFELDKAITRVGNYINLKKNVGQLDDDYAEALYYQACYKSRHVTDNEAKDSHNPVVRDVLANLREAIDIRSEIGMWKDTDQELRKFKSNAEFQKLSQPASRTDAPVPFPVTATTAGQSNDTEASGHTSP